MGSRIDITVKRVGANPDNVPAIDTAWLAAIRELEQDRVGHGLRRQGRSSDRLAESAAVVLPIILPLVMDHEPEFWDHAMEGSEDLVRLGCC